MITRIYHLLWNVNFDNYKPKLYTLLKYRGMRYLFYGELINLKLYVIPGLIKITGTLRVDSALLNLFSIERKNGLLHISGIQSESTEFILF